MTKKFKSGDRVKVEPSAWASNFSTEGADFVGTVIDYDYEEDGFVLVKFDDFTNGHSGSRFYSKKGINYDLNNSQHLYVHENVLCFLEGDNMKTCEEVRHNLQKSIIEYVKHFYPDIDMKKLNTDANRVASKVMSITTDTQSTLSILGILACISE